MSFYYNDSREMFSTIYYYKIIFIFLFLIKIVLFKVPNAMYIMYNHLIYDFTNLLYILFIFKINW